MPTTTIATTPATVVGIAAVKPYVQIDSLPFNSLTVGSAVRGVAVVRRKDVGTTKKGDPFLTVELANRSGSTVIRIWQEQVRAWTLINVGSGVDVSAVVKAGYNGGAAELAIRSVALLPVGHPVEREMHPVSPIPLDRLRERYDTLRAYLAPSSLALLDAVVDATDGAYFVAPAAQIHHHGYLHGLYEHSLEVAELSVACAQHSQAGRVVHYDALIIGALLHDIGKVVEYRWTDGPIRVDTHVAALSYHTVSGGILVERVWQQQREMLSARGVLESDIIALQHVIASHHALKEYGSVVGPCTLEALIIHHADDVSAKVRSHLDALASAPIDVDGWVQPPGWRKSPVLALIPSAVASLTHDGAESMPVDGRGTHSARPSDIDDILRFVRSGVLDPTGCAIGQSDPERVGCKGPTLVTRARSVDVAGGVNPGQREDLIAFITYLIASDLPRWDTRRRLPRATAEAFLTALRAELSPDRRLALDTYTSARA